MLFNMVYYIKMNERSTQKGRDNNDIQRRLFWLQFECNRKDKNIFMVISTCVPSNSKCVKNGVFRAWRHSIHKFTCRVEKKYLYHNLTVHRTWKYSQDITRAEYEVKPCVYLLGVLRNQLFFNPFCSWTTWATALDAIAPFLSARPYMLSSS